MFTLTPTPHTPWKMMKFNADANDLLFAFKPRQQQQQQQKLSTEQHSESNKPVDA
jgi:hypothetical protein